MNREFKFQAWDVLNHCWFTPDFINKEGFAVYTDKNGITIDSKKIRQFTGLKDKNGKEVISIEEITGNIYE